MKKTLLLVCLMTVAARAWANEITFTAVNLANATFSAAAGGLAFGNAINIQVTDNSTGKSVMLLSVQSGSTGPASDFVGGPPLVADYTAGGTNSVLIQSGGTTYLSGVMEDSGRLEAEWPDRAGAFLSRFTVTSVDPSVLTELGLSKVRIAPEGSVSLTLGETAFDGSTLHATLGGSQITIETESQVAETTTMILFGTGMLLAVWSARNRMKATT